MKIKVVAVQGLPHTLTQANGKTFRLFARQTKEIDEKLISKEFHNECEAGNILLIPEAEETIKNSKGGTK